MEATHIPKPPGSVPDAPSPGAPPLTLPRLVLRRAALVVIVGLLISLAWGMATMRDDVAEELQGARAMAALSAQLSTLREADDETARAALAAWSKPSALRHLQFEVRDATGAVVARSQAQRDALLPAWLLPLERLSEWLFDPAAPFEVNWRWPRPDGDAWEVRLHSRPEGEQREALASLVDSVLLLAVVGGAMLAVMAWNTRRAFEPMSRLLQAISDLGRHGIDGRASVPLALPPMPIAELETIAQALRHLDAAWADAEAARRRLAHQMIGLQEDERQRLARELHDEFGQRLTALRANASWLQRRLKDGPDDAAMQQVVDDVVAQCVAIQQDTRAVLARLQPLGPAASGAQGGAGEGDCTLAELGLLLQALCESWQRSPGVATRYTLRLRMIDAAGSELGWDERAPRHAIPRTTALALYRISQEACTNAARHAAAAHCELALTLHWPADAAGSTVHAEWAVSDDGVGLGPAEAAFGRGSGLLGLRERVWSLGGHLTLPVEERAGCVLRADFDLRMHRAGDGDGTTSPAPFLSGGGTRGAA